MARGPGGQAWTGERSAAGGGSPWVVASVVSISTFMEVLDTSIANVALRHIAGGLSATYDEATWVVTTYLVANAIAIPLSTWLSSVIGRKRYYMISVAGFGLASLMCGLAPNLGFLLFARAIQGLAGGGLQPTTQAILVDTFPPQKRGSAMALFGLTVILAPTIGPTLGGWITDNASWHWIFLINVPVAMLSLTLVQLLIVEPDVMEKERKARIAGGLRFDLIGFGLIALGLGCLELTMDRGNRQDWFASGSIRLTAILSALALVLFVWRELTTDRPLLNLRLFRIRNYAISNGLIMVVGVILFGTIQFLPQLLQQVLGYTATQAGEAMTMGGVVTLFVMPLSGILSNKIQPRYLLAFALAVETFALARLIHLSADINFTYAAEMRVFIALGIPFLFVPLSNAAYVGLPPDQSGQASSMLSISRNLGGSMGISLVQTFLAQRQQFHQSRLVEQINPYNPVFQDYTARMGATLHGLGAPAGDAQGQVLGQLYGEVLKQAALLSYIDVFKLLAIIIGCVAPFVLLLKTGAGAAAKPAGAAA